MLSYEKFFLLQFSGVFLVAFANEFRVVGNFACHLFRQSFYFVKDTL